jgi:hypothetical protein
VANHADAIAATTLQYPPGEDLACWVPRVRAGLRACVSDPSICNDYRRRRKDDEAPGWDPTAVLDDRSAPRSKSKSKSTTPTNTVSEDIMTFTSWKACCAPGNGGFKEGCSVASRVFVRA